MARPRDEDTLEPILPKHPPTAPVSEPELDGAALVPAPPARPGWDRIVLVACAVVATLAMVVIAARASSIAEDQEIQTCQVRVYAAQQTDASFGSREDQRTLAREFAKCVGVDPAADDETD